MNRSWQAALKPALALEEQLAPWCERVQVAGGIRRRSARVRSIDFVIVPRRVPGDLFDTEEPGALHPRLVELFQKWQPVCGALCTNKAAVSRYFCFALGDEALRIRIADAENFGLVLALATGSVEFVRNRLIPAVGASRLRLHDARLWAEALGGLSQVSLVVAEESALWEYLHKPPISPEEREPGRWGEW